MKEKMRIVNNETTGRWTKYLREVVFHLVFGLSAQFTQIGGVGKVVEIDESLFGKKRKPNLIFIHFFLNNDTQAFFYLYAQASINAGTARRASGCSEVWNAGRIAASW